MVVASWVLCAVLACAGQREYPEARLARRLYSLAAVTRARRGFPAPTVATPGRLRSSKDGGVGNGLVDLGSAGKLR